MTLKSMFLWFEGWVSVSEKDLKPGMKKLISRLANEHSNNQKLRFMVRTGRQTSRGRFAYSDIPSFHFFVRGKIFVYRIQVPTQRWIDNQGHGGYVKAPVQIFRKYKGDEQS